MINYTCFFIQKTHLLLHILKLVLLDICISSNVIPLEQTYSTANQNVLQDSDIPGQMLK